MNLEFVIDDEKFTIIEDPIFPHTMFSRSGYDRPILQKEIETNSSDIPEACIELIHYGTSYKKALDKFLKLRAFQ